MCRSRDSCAKLDRPNSKQPNQYYQIWTRDAIENAVAPEVAPLWNACSASGSLFPRGALLGPRPSAIMRWHGRIWPIARLSLLGVAFWSGVAFSEPMAPWLPGVEDDVERPDSLEEAQPVFSGALLRGGLAGGQFILRRVAADARRGSARWQVSALRDRETWRPAALVGIGDGREAVFGRVSVGGFAALFGEAMRLSRAVSSVRAPRWGAPSLGPALGDSPGALDGGAIAVRGASSCWAIAGRRADGKGRLAAIGAGIRGRRSALAAAFGAEEARSAALANGARVAPRVAASITGWRRGRESDVSLETLVRSGGWAALFALDRRRGPVALEGRWRYRSWTPRSVAAELTAQTGGHAARARLTWRSWTSRAAADDGVIELEAAARRGGAGPLRVRVGASGSRSEPSTLGASTRYAVADATVARDGPRSFVLSASRRESTRGRVLTAGNTVGARLGFQGGAYGEHIVAVEATRVERGVLDDSHGAAYGLALTASGASLLTNRSGSGVWLSVRGSMERFGARFGYALQRAEDGTGARPWSGTVWLWVGRSSPLRESRAADDRNP